MLLTKIAKMNYFLQISRAFSKRGKYPRLEYEYFLNKLARRRKDNYQKELARNREIAFKEMINVGQEVPHPDTMPIKEMYMQFHDGTIAAIKKEELVDALSNQSSQGYPPLLDKLRELITEFHAPPRWEDRDIITTMGGTEGLSKVLEMSLQRGDALVLPNPGDYNVYLNVIPYKTNYVTVTYGKEGLDVVEMREKLAALWSIRSPLQFTLPKLMYLSPTGNNPTGHVMTDEQKCDVYEIACKYNLLILEDDSCYFLNYRDEELQRSFLSMDTENRVIRIDSFSKLLGGGMRMGVLTGPKEIVHAIEAHKQQSTQTSALSELILLKTLNYLGINGFHEFVKKVRESYRISRDILCTLADKHLVGRAEWQVPEGGPFLWLKVKGVEDVKSMVWTQIDHNHLVVLNGHDFMADPSKPCPYIRLTFSHSPLADQEIAISKLAEIISEEQAKQQRR